MNAPANNKLKSTSTIAIGAGIVIVVAGLIYLFFTPKIWQASAKLKIEQRDTAKSWRPYDPNLAPIECVVLRSNALLDEAIQNLDLVTVWGKRYHTNSPADLEETRARLKTKMNVHPMPNSSLIEVAVTSEDREETAKIANELVRVYKNFRDAQRQTLIRGKVKDLKNQWDEQNAKVQAAQTKVDQLAHEMNVAQSTNTFVYYDKGSYDLLLSNRATLDGQIVLAERELTKLKGLDQPQLREVLSALDPDPKTLLNVALAKLREAEKGLAEAQAAVASPNVTTPKKVVDDLEQRISKLVGGIMTVKETDYAALKDEFASVNEKLKHAKVASEGQMSLQNTDYAHAVEELKELKQNRDDLQEKIESTDANNALMPTDVTAEIMDPAEVPSRPAVPDSRIALGAIGTGGFLILAGAVALLIALKPKTVPAKK